MRYNSQKCRSNYNHNIDHCQVLWVQDVNTVQMNEKNFSYFYTFEVIMCWVSKIQRGFIFCVLDTSCKTNSNVVFFKLLPVFLFIWACHSPLLVFPSTNPLYLPALINIIRPTCSPSQLLTNSFPGSKFRDSFCRLPVCLQLAWTPCPEIPAPFWT